MNKQLILDMIGFVLFLFGGLLIVMSKDKVMLFVVSAILMFFGGMLLYCRDGIDE